MLMGEVRAEQLMRSVAPSVRESLTEEQDQAIREAVRRGDWDRHPIDLRMVLPTPFGRYYATLVAGPDRRSKARLAADRRRNPLVSLSNVAFVAVGTLVCGLCALGLLSLMAGLIAP